MYCAPSDIIATACGHHVAPFLPSACSVAVQPFVGKGTQVADKLSQCALVPAYIAYGLLENAVLEQKPPVTRVGKEGTGAPAAKSHASQEEQEFHQQMLQKLALHLAAQPESPNEPLQAPTPQHEPVAHRPASLQQSGLGVSDVAPESGHQAHAPARELDKEGSRAHEAKGNHLSQHEQEFQQEMLRKLALHLAAQDQLEEQRKDVPLESLSDPKEVAEDKEVTGIETPEAFPATPSSFGDCEHYYIGDDVCDQAEEETLCCWPSNSQWVRVPVHVAHGLLGGIVHKRDGSGRLHGKGSGQSPAPQGPREQAFHQEMLQKLALHLAAQQDSSPSLRGQREEQPPRFKSKVAWADMTDDVETPQDDTQAEKAQLRPDGRRARGSTGDKAGKRNVPSFNLGQRRPDHQELQQDLLRKLALHLSAQPDAEERPRDAPSDPAGEARAIGEDKARCDGLIAELEPSSDGARTARAAEVAAWATLRARALSFTPSGCRLVQRVAEVASERQREELLEALLQDVEELYTSPYANHVVAKLIELMPAGKLARIGTAMRGRATTVARHQFGSRILERLVEHCGEDEIGPLLDELLEDLEALARHQFGNYVVARVLEHGDAARRQRCVQVLLPHVLPHAMHKTASNIVQRMLEHADVACQAAIADAFLAGTGEHSLEAIAVTRYGSFVVQRLVDRFHPRIGAVKARVKAAHSKLQASGFSQRKIVQFLGEPFFRE